LFFFIVCRDGGFIDETINFDKYYFFLDENMTKNENKIELR